MEPIFAISSASILSSPFRPTPRSLKTLSFDPTKRRPFCRTTPMASSKEADNRGSRMVDENMIVLRKRIREMKVAEGEFDLTDWTEWEKTYCSNYNLLICEAMGVLQNQLMNTRPCVAFGMAVLVALTLLLSPVLLVHHFL